MAALGSYPNLFFGVIIIANTTIGIVQEIRAKRTIDKLSLLNAPQVKVIRDGREQTIDASSVVRDDIIKIEAGNQICADCVLLEGQLETDESLLTGESEPVRKAQNDTLLSGSFAISGSCLARVEKVGAMSYVQTLAAKAKKYQKPKSELMRSINAIIKVLAIIIFPLGIATFFTTVHQLGGYADVGQYDRHDSVGNGAFDKRCADRFRNQACFQKGDGQGFVLYRNACPRKRALPRQNGDNHGRHNDGGNGALRRKRASLRAYARVYFCYGRKKSDGARA